MLKFHMLRINIIIISFLIGDAYAARLCDTYKWMACPDAFGASRSTTNTSAPLNSAAAPVNPASMSTKRGFGVEALKFKHWYDVSVISGTGVIGSAIGFSNQENTFFGGHTPETSEQKLDREEYDKKFKSPKLTGIIAFSPIRGKNENSFKLNVGLIGKYNQESKRYHYGAGASASFMMLSVGAARFRDDYQNVLNENVDQHYVNSYTFGVKFSSLAVDWTYFKNHTALPARIRYLTATFFTKRFMFTYGARNADVGKVSSLISGYPTETEKVLDTFLGVQYLINKQIIIGAFANYYLLDELSLGLTIFI